MCGRDVIGEMMELLHHPEHGMRVIHIAGTNGKGSVAAFVSSILRAASFCVGQFTSPHLLDFGERIQVDGRQIPREDVQRLGEQLLKLPMQAEGTMFDYCLAMACLYFREQNCDFVVLETGLGGRLDATAGLDVVPEVCVITNIGYDHTAYLGETLSEIAAEKAGILKAGAAAVIGRMEPEAEQVVTARCEDLKIPWVRAEEYPLMPKGAGGDMSAAGLGLPGAYQRENAATAAAVWYTLCRREDGMLRGRSAEWKESVLRQGLSEARWPGRMEILGEDPFLLVDGAHNPQGVAALARSLREAYPGEAFVFVVGVMADKAYRRMFAEAVPLARCFYTAPVDCERGLLPEVLAQTLRRAGGEVLEVKPCASVDEALEQALAAGRSSGCKIVVFGSLYFIGNVKERYQ